ncbi:hypothetical protein Bpfe_015982 [Biomphalaria pfeifferi]|uniref:Uncharacterized protein n=1 Tax=Biomphalaria pfeifferi TaxID=112525 RepID=A0AAD8BIB3_BIOPF|nr:hypothetical protein Bpfe_015982 [Biomphalaria pfeifferi]
MERRYKQDETLRHNETAETVRDTHEKTVPDSFKRTHSVVLSLTLTLRLKAHLIKNHTSEAVISVGLLDTH